LAEHSTAWLVEHDRVAGSFRGQRQRKRKFGGKRRAKSEAVVHPVHGRVMLRDQQPLNEKKLKGALQDGLSPRDWYLLLNRKVFFWGPEARLKILQGARLYGAQRQTIVEIDTAQFLERYASSVSPCHMNSRSTQPMAWDRGKDTFLPLEEYPLAERRRKYGVKNAVAEVTVDYAVPDLRDFVVTAYEIGGGEEKVVLWPMV
jgi:hypothetical protein